MKISTDDCYNNVKKSTKFQSNADILDGGMTSSNFDLMSDNLRRGNSLDRDDVTFVNLLLFIERTYW